MPNVLLMGSVARKMALTHFFQWDPQQLLKEATRMIRTMRQKSLMLLLNREMVRRLWVLQHLFLLLHQGHKIILFILVVRIPKSFYIESC